MKHFIFALSLLVSAAAPAQIRTTADSIAVKSISGIVNKMLDIALEQKGESKGLERVQ